MTNSDSKIIIIGYGNPGRLDDGLGPAFADRIDDLQMPGVTVESDYQLSVEYANQIADFDVVLFVDASVSAPDPFECVVLDPIEASSFTSHSLAPGQVLYLAQSLFNARLRAYVLGIRGHEFNEFGERLCEQAQANLEEAVGFFLAHAEKDWHFETDHRDKVCCSTERELTAELRRTGNGHACNSVD